MPDDPIPAPAPAPAPAPQPHPAPAPRASDPDPDELPDVEPAPTKAQFQRLRSVHKSTLDELREIRRERDELKAIAENAGKRDQQLLEQTVIAQASGVLQDPQDAIRMLDLSKHKLGADGTIDAKGIKAAVEKLAEDKPYLKAGAHPTGPRPLPGPGGRAPAPVGEGAKDRNAEMNAIIRRAAGVS